MSTALTREQVRQVDRIAIEEYGISGLVLMENAGRNAACVILDELTRTKGNAPTPVVVVFCGTGNNGGDGFVIARHLVNSGVDVRIALAGEKARLTPDAAANHRICEAMGISIVAPGATDVSADDVVVDALLGTGFSGQVREEMAHVIERVNSAQKRSVVAIDVPSGLDCDTGESSNATIVADATVTFVADKVGFRSNAARRFVGRVHVADIGAPPEIIERVRQR